MKHLEILILVALVAFCGLSSAQVPPNTNAPPSGIVDLGNTIFGYLTSFNTNMHTFTATRFDLWTGLESIQNSPSPLVNEFGLSYDVWRPTPATNNPIKTAFALEANVRDSGSAGDLVSGQGGASFSAIIWDTKIGAYVDGGYDFENGATHKFYGEVGVRAKKGIGDHFYFGVGLGVKFPSNKARVFGVFTGATF